MKRGGSSVSSRKGEKLSDAFAEEIVALLPRLRRFAAALTRDRVEADDLCQETIERAFRHRRQWQEGTRLDSWMYRIMRNCWIDQARSRTRQGQTFLPGEHGPELGAKGGQEASVELQDVNRALLRLPGEQREAIVLVMVEGYSYKEAAEIAGCPVGTLNSRLVRGRDALLAQLGEGA